MGETAHPQSLFSCIPAFLIHQSPQFLPTRRTPKSSSRLKKSPGSVPKDASPLEFLTAAGLGATGASARFRIYVVLTTGNERGSETVTVTRP